MDPETQISSWRHAGRAVLPFFAILAVVALAITAGTMLRRPVGLVGADATTLPSASLASTAASPSAEPTVRATAAPTAVPTSVMYANWERIDLPDPAQGVYGGATPQAVVAFAGGYVAAGTINRACCADGDPTTNSGAVWLSDDGRNWEVIEPKAFAHSSIRQLLTDGSQLYAFGVHAEATDADNHYRFAPAGWISTDGHIWSPMPDLPTIDGGSNTYGVDFVVALGPAGFVAAVNESGDGGEITGFWARAADASAWQLTSGPFPGQVTAVESGIAVGKRAGEPLADGTQTTDALVWRATHDGTWDGPHAIDHGWLSGLAGGTHLQVAVGTVDEYGPDGSVGSPGAIWVSRDGMQWARQEAQPGSEASLKYVFAIGEAFVAIGDTAVDGSVNAFVIVSSDATEWARVDDADAFEGVNNEVRSVIGTSVGLLAVGARWDPDTSHAVPVAWLAVP